jgi:hypothetical protein
MAGRDMLGDVEVIGCMMRYDTISQVWHPLGLIQVQIWRYGVMDVQRRTAYVEVVHFEKGAGIKKIASYSIIQLQSFPYTNFGNCHISSEWLSVAPTKPPIGWHSTFLHVLECPAEPSHNFLVLFADIVAYCRRTGFFVGFPRESTP